METKPVVEITPTDRPVYRVKVTKNGLRPTYRYFTSPGAAMKAAAWEIVAGRHKIYERGYTANGIKCECLDPESGPGYYSAGWEGCPLHDHRDGYYARMVARIIARMKHQAEALRY